MMKPDTQKLWAKQNRHEGDRWKLFRAVGGEVGAGSVLYPGSFVDIAPSFVFPSVTYIDTDRRTPRSSVIQMAFGRSSHATLAHRAIRR